MDVTYEKVLNRVVLCMVISESFIAASLVLNAAQGLVELDITILNNTLSMTTLLGLMGYCLATLLGLWLVISILRSGKL